MGILLSVLLGDYFRFRSKSAREKIDTPGGKGLRLFKNGCARWTPLLLTTQTLLSAI